MIKQHKYFIPADRLACRFCLAAMVLFCAPVFAQAEEGSQTSVQSETSKKTVKDNFVVEEVVVTATRRETQLLDTPMSIWTKTGEEIEIQGDVDIKTLYQSIPGMSYTANSETFNTITIRGLNSYYMGTSMVSVYLDEIPVTDQTSGGIRQIPGAMFDLARVEVLRGPQGTSYGEDNVTGTIRYITNAVDLNSFDFKAKAGIRDVKESDDYGSLLQGVVNVPLIEDRLGVRIAAHYRDIPGTIDIGPPRSKNDVNTREEKGVRLKLRWDATDSLQFNLTGDYQHSRAGGPGLAQFPYGDNGRTTTNFTNGGKDVNKIANLTINYDLGWAELISSTSYFNRKTYQAEQQSQALGDQFFEGFLSFFFRIPGVSPFFIPGLPAGRMLESFGGFSDNSTERTVQELRLVSTHEGNWSWTAGLFYSDGDMTSGRLGAGLSGFQYNPNPGFEPAIDLLNAMFPSTVSEFSRSNKSAFADVNYRFNDAWDLTLAARFSQSKQRTVEGVTLDEDFISPKAVLSWRPRDGLMIYGSLSQGFRPSVSNPSLVTLQNTLRTWPAPVVNLDAWLAYLERNKSSDGDEVISYELGLKTTLWDDRVSLSTAVYHMLWIDQIAQVQFAPPHLGTGATIFSANAGEAHSTGFEVEASILLTERLTVSFGGSLNEAQLDKIDDVTAGLFTYAPIAEGADLPNAPGYSANLAIAYQIPLANGWNIDANAYFAWVDEQVQSLSLDAVETSTPVKNINARLFLTSPDQSWRFSLYGENLSDQVVVHQNNVLGKYYGRPRTIGLEVSYFLHGG